MGPLACAQNCWLGISVFLLSWNPRKSCQFHKCISYKFWSFISIKIGSPDKLWWPHIALLRLPNVYRISRTNQLGSACHPWIVFPLWWEHCNWCSITINRAFPLNNFGGWYSLHHLKKSLLFLWFSTLSSKTSQNPTSFKPFPWQHTRESKSI